MSSRTQTLEGLAAAIFTHLELCPKSTRSAKALKQRPAVKKTQASGCPRKPRRTILKDSQEKKKKDCFKQLRFEIVFVTQQ